MLVGEEIFNVADGYDEEMWDDTALIRNYEKAYEASRRELIRRRKVKKKRDWNLGDACRILHTSDGLEYEGVVVLITARKATVRLHGYNEEVEMDVIDLEPSLGQEQVDQQIAQAELDQVEEEPFEDELKVGCNCRARWSLDDVVYEGTIESVDKKKNKVRVRFLGYGNEETVASSELFATKGEDWRQQQIEDSKDDIPGADSHTDPLIDGQHPEEFSTWQSTGYQLPDLGHLSIHPSNSKSAQNVKTGEERTKRKEEGKVKKKSKAETSKTKNGPSEPSKPVSALPDPRLEPDFSALHGINLSQGPRAQSQRLNSFPGPEGLEVPKTSSAGFPPLLIPPPPPRPFPPPTGQTQDNEALQSMLIAWYMAGYHTGYYQALGKQDNKKYK